MKPVQAYDDIYKTRKQKGGRKDEKKEEKYDGRKGITRAFITIKRSYPRSFD